MIVLDASVLIAYADDSDAHHGRAVDVLSDVDGDLVVSSITLAEFLVKPIRDGILPRATEFLADLGVEQVDLPADAPVRLATLRAQIGLPLPGCCVLLAAEQVSGTVATFDDRLARAAAGLGLTATR